LAEEALVLFYEAKDALRWIRSPGGFVGEGQTRKPMENETLEEKEIFDHAYIVIERYNKQQELFNKIHAMRYRYRANFGTQEAKPFDDLRGVINDIITSSRQLSRDWLGERRAQPTDRGFQKLLDRIEQEEAIFYEGPEDEDPIIPRVNAAVEAIEQKCRSVQQIEASFWERIKSWF